MYKLLIAALLISATASAQLKEGKVIYERKMNMHKDMPPEAEQFKAMVPEFNINKMELIFTGSQSLFHPLPNSEEDQMPAPGGEERRVIRFGGMDAESFRDYDKEQLVEARELGPKTYIIEDSLHTPKWKLEDDTLRILGYLCHKATTTQPNMMRRRAFMPPGGDSAQTPPPPPPDMPVTVWYTEEIESQAGPDNLFGLPGLILGATVNNGTVVYKALSVEQANKDLVKAPTNGKKITREEYRKMMQEQMRGMRGGPGGPQIRIVRD